MIGPEKGRYREKVAQLSRPRSAAEQAGFASIWVPQIPNDFDAHDRDRPHGPGDDADRARHRGACRSRPATRSRWRSRRCRPRRCARAASRSASVRRTIGSSRTCSACRTTSPRASRRDYIEVLNAAFAGPGSVDVENDDYRVHNPLDITDLAPTPILVAALAPVMLRIAGELASGTILWMADERAIGDHVVPRITKAAAGSRASPRRASSPASRLRCAATTRSTARERGRTKRSATPSTRRTTSACSSTATPPMSATSSPAGDETAVVERLRSFRDAGATDLSVRVLPLGPDRAARIESRDRTLAFLSSLVSRALTGPTSCAPAPGRSPASACSKSVTSWPDRSPRCCSPISAPT